VFTSIVYTLLVTKGGSLFILAITWPTVDQTCQCLAVDKSRQNNKKGATYIAVW